MLLLKRFYLKIKTNTKQTKKTIPHHPENSWFNDFGVIPPRPYRRSPHVAPLISVASPGAHTPSSTGRGLPWAQGDFFLTRGAQMRQRSPRLFPPLLPWPLMPYEVFSAAEANNSSNSPAMMEHSSSLFLFLKFCLHCSVVRAFSNHPWCSEVLNSKIYFFWTKICHINTSLDLDIFSCISREMK